MKTDDFDDDQDGDNDDDYDDDNDYDDYDDEDPNQVEDLFDCRPAINRAFHHCKNVAKGKKKVMFVMRISCFCAFFLFVTKSVVFKVFVFLYFCSSARKEGKNRVFFV